jgi:Tfp pilus assembly protein PilF
MTEAAELRARALAAARAGNDAEADSLFATAVHRFPRDAALINSAGNFHASAGRPLRALELFEAALRVDPKLGEAAINRAVVLTRLDRAKEAVEVLIADDAGLAAQPRYWTALGAAQIADADRAGAARSYEKALVREPGNRRALAGRARMALERGEDSAAAWHERALALQPGDPHLLAGLARALDAAGCRREALGISEALAAQIPNWTEGMELHAELRWADGNGAAFCDHYARAADGGGPEFFHSWLRMLAGADMTAGALNVAEQARRHWPQDTSFALLEASFASRTGDADKASRLFVSGPDTQEWHLHHGRHLLRLQDPGAAEALLARCIEADPQDVGAWSLIDVAWRMLDDPRHHWLMLQEGLVREIELDLSPDEFAQLVRQLALVHRHASMPIGQSVRGGSQTRGALFSRHEPVFQSAERAIERTLERYRAGLPAVDRTHPLLRHRDRNWKITGSWSVRLAQAGRHTAHIHPQGMVSSACYLRLPVPTTDEDDAAGHLELGRPPSDLGVDLPPLQVIAPRVGYCVLFPSALFHGTRPFAQGDRMTMAFDVAPAGP